MDRDLTARPPQPRSLALCSSLFDGVCRVRSTNPDGYKIKYFSKNQYSALKGALGRPVRQHRLLKTKADFGAENTPPQDQSPRRGSSLETAVAHSLRNLASEAIKYRVPQPRPATIYSGKSEVHWDSGISDKYKYVYVAGQHSRALSEARAQLEAIKAHHARRRESSRLQRNAMLPLPRPIQRLGCE